MKLLLVAAAAHLGSEAVRAGAPSLPTMLPFKEIIFLEIKDVVLSKVLAQPNSRAL